MEHIVQFAISIDDDTITNLVTENAEKEIIKDLKQQVTNKLFESRSYYKRNADPESGDPLSDYAQRIVEDLLEQHKEIILDKAAMHLADKLARSKKGKEILDNLEV